MDFAADKQAFSIAELARVYGVSDSFIRKEIRRGRLTPFRIGPKIIRISRLEWEAYLAKNGTGKGDLPDGR
jgi:excisionase family DNA binding protein